VNVTSYTNHVRWVSYIPLLQISRSVCAHQNYENRFTCVNVMSEDKADLFEAMCISSVTEHNDGFRWEMIWMLFERKDIYLQNNPSKNGHWESSMEIKQLECPTRVYFLSNIEPVQCTSKKGNCRKDILCKSLSRIQLFKPFASR